MDVSLDRRRTKRYPVTVSARVHAGGRSYRAEILDVSAGGLLLSAADGLTVDVGAALRIEAALIGRVRARVVGVSGRGIHLETEPATHQYDAAIRRLSSLSQSWWNAALRDDGAGSTA